MSLFIQRSLTPAKVSSIDLDLENKRANVFMEPDQVSLAIGKGGSNIKLASQLTEMEIDVFRNKVDERPERFQVTNDCGSFKIQNARAIHFSQTAGWQRAIYHQLKCTFISNNPK